LNRRTGDHLSFLRTDIISLLDIDFKDDHIAPSYLTLLEQRAGNPDVDHLFRESFEWVYYGSALPGCRRFNYPPPGDIPHARCSSLLINPANGAAVYLIWQTIRGDGDPLEWKRQAWNLFEQCDDPLHGLGLEIKEIERQYPFVAIRVDTEDVAGYCSEHAEELGRIFTGNFERDEREYLLEIMRLNLSRRDYERLFILWTDVLGVYSRNVSEEEQEKTMLRGVQVFENCILVRRLLRNLSEQADRLSSRLTVPRPWAVNRISQSFLQIERQMIVAPPVQSVESERLLRGAYKNFGIDSLVEGTRNSCNFMERRLQWSKTQFLVAVGVIAYLLDKLKVFENIGRILIKAHTS